MRHLAKIIAAPNPIRTKVLAVLDQENGDIEKAIEVLQDKKLSSKGVWESIKKILKSLDDASYEEFAMAIKDHSKQELLEQVIEKASSMKKNSHTTCPTPTLTFITGRESRTRSGLWISLLLCP